MFSFKSKYTFEERRNEAQNVLNKYSGRIPVICEKVDNSPIKEIDKKKFLVPAELTLGQFIYILRKRIRLDENQALFLFINNTLVPIGETFEKIYDEHRNDDLFLYISYSGENTFG